MINVLINGVNGRMGQEVLKQINKTEIFQVIAGIDRFDMGGHSFPVYTNTYDIKEIPDVIIDFSVPEASLNILNFAVSNKIPIVIATTGFTSDDIKAIKDLSCKIPIFQSGNMSYEINIMADMVSKLAKLLPNSDIEIVDIHHNNKIDSPSGTALILADSINESLNNNMTYEYNRHEKRKKRADNEIGIHSLRGGTVVGKHTVCFFGENETLEITHTVDSRSIFANGAIKAAGFIVGKKSGFYSMKNLIK